MDYERTWYELRERLVDELQRLKGAEWKGMAMAYKILVDIDHREFSDFLDAFECGKPQSQN